MTLEGRLRALTPSAEGPIFQRIDEKEQTELFIGKDSLGYPMLLIICEEEPAAHPTYRAIEVTINQRHDLRWALVIKLTKLDLYHVFLCLCDDLVSVLTAQTKHKGKPADIVLYRLLRWQRLMDHGRDGILDETALRGLIGELLVLEKDIFPRWGIADGIRSWSGPLHGAQDFSLPECFIEVKACRRGAGRITISSICQLDTESKRLFLVVTEIEKTLQTTANRFSIIELVARIRNVIEHADLIEEFEDRLAAVGYLDRKEYESDFFVLHGVHYYDVTNDFPKITRRMLSLGIIDASYELDLSQCATFQINAIVR
jgi:hypothetical protein